MHQKHASWIQDFLQNCRQLNKSEHTIRNYRADLEKFVRWYEHHYKQPLYRTDGATIGQYQDYLAGLNAAPTITQKTSVIQYLVHSWSWWVSLLTQRTAGKTLNPPTGRALLQNPLAVASRKRHLSTIKNFFEYLKQTHEDHQKIFLVNPVKSKLHNIKLKDVDQTHTALLTSADWDLLKTHVYLTSDRLMIYLLYWGGLRLSELTGLKFSDFNKEQGSVTFARKGGSLHQLKLREPKKIFEQLDFYRQLQFHDHLFTSQKGRVYSSKTMYNRIQKLLAQAGCGPHLTPHSFRKACATNYYKQTKDLLKVRDYLNHSDAKVTQTYIDTH